MDHGRITNTGTATGTAAQRVEGHRQSSVTIPAHPESRHRAQEVGQRQTSRLGTLITYSYNVTNSGNVTLDPVKVTDPMPGLSAISCPDTSLGAPAIARPAPPPTPRPRATWTTARYHNTGTATGTPPNGEPVTDTSSLSIPAAQNPAISLVKTANIELVLGPGHAVTYSYKVTNTGNVTLTRSW